MIIVHIMGGVGNQLFEYASARSLAHKLNTELKMDKRVSEDNKFRPYRLGEFNIKDIAATEEDFKHIEEVSKIRNADYGKWGDGIELLDYPDDVYLRGYWQDERFFANIADILREELTLKVPLSNRGKDNVAFSWEQKILSTECSVSIHIRHGDYIHDPNANKGYGLIPLEYYYECIEILKKQYENLKAFVFSDDLKWVQNNLKLDIPVEFVSGCEKDVEELYLMSLCKHNIIANSTFSWWGAWLNKNPDKKVFTPKWVNGAPSLGAENYANLCSSDNTDKNIVLDSQNWIRIPVDFQKKLIIESKPIFSIIVFVENNSTTIDECLKSMLSQDYKFYGIIIIDNASNDNSSEICRQIANTNKNISYIKLYEQTSKCAALNMAIKVSQGEYLLFFNGNDYILPDVLSKLYMINNYNIRADIVHSVAWGEEKERNKFIGKSDPSFSTFNGSAHFTNINEEQIIKLLVNQGMNNFLGTNMFKREFLTKNNITFNENIKNVKVAEQVFLIECFSQTSSHIFTSQVFYLTSK
ncbi:MAG: alpha-1,2-fucosyltransferase [Selenomonadaceae bacterium]|nr:alpha-1,2-fucosyltransferase [Selenomonadaceae bacterium]